MPKANNWGCSPDARKIAEAGTYPKQSGQRIPNGVPRGGVNAQSYQNRGNVYEFESVGIDSDADSISFELDQLLGFPPGSGKRRNTRF